MSKQPRTIAAAEKVLCILKTLQGHSLDGLSNLEISKAVGESPSLVHRGLATLMQTGWVTRLDNGRFAPSIAALSFARTHLEELDRASTRISEIHQRVAAGAHR